MAGEENFLERWSRMKRERAAERAAAAKAAAPAPANPARGEEPGAPPLPPVEELTPDSDFAAFMSPKVSDALRRAALKTLFRSSELNVPDPFEPFSGDWTAGEPIPEEVLSALYQARGAIPRELEAKAEQEQADSSPREARHDEPRKHEEREAGGDDGAGRQDP